MNFKKLMSTYAKFNKTAASLINSKGKTLQKIQDGFKKATENKGSLTSFWEELQLLFSLVKDYASGSYTAIPKTTIISVLAALLYFISPLDVIPDFILGLGLVDDVIILKFVYNKMKKELDKYQAWKLAQKKIIHIVS